MAGGGRDDKKKRDQLRQEMLADGCTYEQIAAAMTREFGDRSRVAWRHAHGWTQDQVAARFNEMVGDQQACMTGNRISDYERWPLTKGPKPTVRTFRLLAILFSAKASNLIDSHDCQKLDTGDLLALSTVDSVIMPRQLPSTISHFVGRTRELDILTTQLDRTADNSGPVVITAIGGTAGIGKTTLAIHWARTHLDQFPDGQLYVDLHGFDPSGTPVTPDTAIRGFLDAFQVPPDKIPVNPDDQAALYRTLAEDRRLMIMLDNARDADQVRPLLPGSPTCLVLVTSRQQLGSLIARNQAVHITLDFMTTAEARQLLTDFLGAKRIQAEPDTINELIQLCVGLPIALTIAAARILMDDPHLPLSTLVDQLREHHQRLDTLATGDSHLTDIRAVLSWSYTALSPQAARLFRLLGLHPGPDIATPAAASLAGLPEQDTHTLLTELTQAHLIKQHIPGRYQFHDLLRVYASEQAIREEPEPLQQAALHRVLDYYLNTGVAANQQLAPHWEPITLEAPQPGVVRRQISNYAQALEWFTVEYLVLLAAIDYAATHKFDVHAWQLPWTLATFLHRRGHLDDYAATQRIAVAAANRLGDRRAEALTLRLLSNAYNSLGRGYTDALACLQRALALCLELGDCVGQADTHLSLCWIYDREGQYTEALNHAQQALDLFRTTGNQIWQARALNNVGWNQAALGHYQQALTSCQHALSLFNDTDELMGVAESLGNLGYIYQHLGQHIQGITHCEGALHMWRELGDHYSEASTLTHLGDTHHATGNHPAAREAWQQALTIFDQLDHPNAQHVRTKLAALDTDPDESTTEGQLKD